MSTARRPSAVQRRESPFRLDRSRSSEAVGALTIGPPRQTASSALFTSPPTQARDERTTSVEPALLDQSHHRFRGVPILVRRDFRQLLDVDSILEALFRFGEHLEREEMADTAHR